MKWLKKIVYTHCFYSVFKKNIVSRNKVNKCVCYNFRYESYVPKKKGKYGEGMNEKVTVILWMNALLEPKLFNPTKTMNCW